MDQVHVDTRDMEVALTEYGIKARNIRRLMPVFAEMLVSAVDDVYEAEGPDWEPLAEATIRQRRNKSREGTTILQDTGVMAKSTAPGYGRDFVEARAGVEYARFHSTGTSRMPRRDPFELGPFEEGVLEDVDDVLLRELAL